VGSHRVEGVEEALKERLVAHFAFALPVRNIDQKSIFQPQSKVNMRIFCPLLAIHTHQIASKNVPLFGAPCRSLRLCPPCESGPLRAVHLSRHKWPEGLVNKNSGRFSEST